MSEFSLYLAEHHCLGLVVGLATFLIIGIFHPLVIKGEYYFGVRCWWAFLVLGIAGCAASLWVDDKGGQCPLVVLEYRRGFPAARTSAQGVVPKTAIA